MESAGTKCVKCGSPEMFPASVKDEMGTGFERDLTARIDADPYALVLKETVRCGLRAMICPYCGFTEFYAEEPRALQEAYRRAQERRGES